MITVTRTHEICAGHRVFGHEGKCKYLHGHNYKFEFTCTSEELDSVGRVIDFSVIKDVLCNWVERNWDHKCLIYEKDPLFDTAILLGRIQPDDLGIVVVPFNPTAENIAKYLVEISPNVLLYTGVSLIKVTVWETSKCCATYTVKDENVISSRNGRGNVEEKKSRFEENVQKV